MFSYLLLAQNEYWVNESERFQDIGHVVNQVTISWLSYLPVLTCAILNKKAFEK